MLCSGALTLFMVALANAATVPKPSSLMPVDGNISPSSNRSLSIKANTTSHQHPNAIWYYHIPGTTLSLYVQDNGDHLPTRDIYACLDMLGYDIVQQIIMYGEGALSSFASYRHGIVKVVFRPFQMTWMAAGAVVDVLEAIVAHDHWNYASHVTVQDSGVGTVGYLTMQYHAPRMALKASGKGGL